MKRVLAADQEEFHREGEWDRVESTGTEGEEDGPLVWEELEWDPSRDTHVWAPHLWPAGGQERA